MRILLLNYEFPPIGGGSATASAQIARHMARRGAEVVVLTSHFKGLPRRETRDGYRIHRVPTIRQSQYRCSVPEMGAYVSSSIPYALRVASSFKPDLMHVFFGMPTGPVGLVVSRIKHIPYLLSLRGGDVPGSQDYGQKHILRLTLPLTRQIWSQAGAVVVNGEGLLDRARRTLPGKEFELIPNGVDLDVFQPPAEPAGRSSGLRLLFVGRLDRAKGLHCLLEGLAALEPRERAGLRVDLVGDGPEKGNLQRLAGELGLGGQVSFPGWVERSKIAGFYQSADMFVFPSFEEGMPNVVVEAMACGLPVVASDIPGVRGLVRDHQNGLLVPPADAPAITQAVRYLLHNPEDLKRMGLHSRELALGMSWAAVADRYLELSGKIVESRVSGLAGTVHA